MTVGYFQQISNMRSGIEVLELKRRSCDGDINAFCELCIFCSELGGIMIPWQSVEEILGDVFDSILLNDYVELFGHALQVQINTTIPEEHQLNVGGIVLDNYFSKLIKSNFSMENAFRIVKMLFMDQHERTRLSYLKIHQGFLLNQLTLSPPQIKVDQINWILHQIDIKINE